MLFGFHTTNSKQQQQQCHTCHNRQQLHIFIIN